MTENNLLNIVKSEQIKEITKDLTEVTIDNFFKRWNSERHSNWHL